MSALDDEIEAAGRAAARLYASWHMPNLLGFCRWCGWCLECHLDHVVTSADQCAGHRDRYFENKYGPVP